jgi:MFS family permease
MVAFSLSFAMMAMFFFMALYIQNVLGYSPLEAGVRFLPTTLVIMVGGPIAGRLTDRIGPRVLMTAGLVTVSVSMYLQSLIDMHTTYGDLLPALMLMGLGMGLTMSPMSTAAMNAVDRTKSGVASGTLTMSRMVGGTLGVAVLGAIVESEQGVTEFVSSLARGLTLATIVTAAAAVLAYVLIEPGTAAAPSDIAEAVPA